jgi:hypothetical protein
MNLKALPAVLSMERTRPIFAFETITVYHSRTMFCPSCGTEYTIELKYCNRCGANLNTDLTTQPQAAPISFTKPIAILGAIILLLTLGGFGLLVGGAIELSRTARIDPDNIAAIVGVGMLSLLTMDIFLVRLLTKIINASLSSGTQTKTKPKAVSTSARPPLMQLPQSATSPLQAVPSVTEGTTRFLEPVHRETSVDDPALARKIDR